MRPGLLLIYITVLVIAFAILVILARAAWLIIF